MIDWNAIFDQCWPAAGLAPEALARFVDQVKEPLRPEEHAEILRQQSNPYPKHDPLHRCWRPIDPRRWLIPTRPLPPTYLEFLTWSNGGEFHTGEREFGFFDAVSVREMLLAYQLPQYMPGALPIAFNGGGTFYLFDLRQPAVSGEYPVVASHAGNLGWERDEHAPLAATFLEACQGRDRCR